MKTVFSGQQEGERVLYKIKSHPFHRWFKLGRVAILSILIVVLFGVMSSVTSWLMLMGLLVGASFFFIGWWGLMTMDRNSESYITDRRVVRFVAQNPWTVNQRSLSWDEVVKAKTKSSGLFWRLLGTGAVVVHARSTIIPAEGQKSEQIITNDDIEFDHVIYYQDLGNYLDKVLYLFKHSKKELADLRKFVAKPTGKRY